MDVFLLAGHARSTSNDTAQHGSAAKPVQPEPVPVSRFRPSPGEQPIKNRFSESVLLKVLTLALSLVFRLALLACGSRVVTISQCGESCKLLIIV